MKTEEKIKTVLSDVFDIPVSEISDKSSLHTVKKWDSQQHMQLIVALEREFKIRFDDFEIPTLVNYPIITATVKSYLEE